MSNSQKLFQRINIKRILIRLIVVGWILITAGAAGIGGFVFAQNLTIKSHELAKNIIPRFGDESRSPDEEPLFEPDTQSLDEPLIEPSLTPWDGVGRVTVLLMGLDYRDWKGGGKNSRSDTMMLLTLDPLERTAGVLSIPRDMWVSIPGFEYGKINTAHYLGDAYKYPGGGAGLAVKTVENFLGIPINYYARVDFSAFVNFIDEIGGVKIDVPEPITIDLLGSGWNTKKKLQSGVQVLPGEWALAYARNRYTEGGDFDRARRQQQVVLAIRDRILSFDMLPVLVEKAPRLYSELSEGIHTNLNLDEVIKLAVLASRIPADNIQGEVIGKEFVEFGRSPDNLSILIPHIDKIHLVRNKLFGSSGALSAQTPGDSRERMVAEEARIIIRNGTYVENLASRTADYLRSQGVNVVEVSETGGQSTLTNVTDYTGKPFTLRFIVDLMEISSIRVYSSYGTSGGGDIEIVLGNDWSANNPMP